MLKPIACVRRLQNADFYNSVNVFLRHKYGAIENTPRIKRPLITLWWEKPPQDAKEKQPLRFQDSLKILLWPKSTKQHDYTARHIFVKSFLKKCLCPFDQQPVLAAIYRRSGVGARIAFAAGKLRRSYSLTFLHCSALARQFTAAMYGFEHYSVIFNHSKTSPAHGMAGPLHIQRIINLEKKCWSLSCGLGSNFFLLICGYK